MADEIDMQKVKQLLDRAENSIREARSILISSSNLSDIPNKIIREGNVVEGVYDGEKMIGQDQKSYSIPSNYASKSKLVTGDVLKLTIQTDGTFLYKQTGPIDRKKLVGVLEEVEPGKFEVVSGESRFRVLSASITYFKAKTGDKLTILIPKQGTVEWAAVENIISV